MGNQEMADRRNKEAAARAEMHRQSLEQQAFDGSKNEQLSKRDKRKRAKAQKKMALNRLKEEQAQSQTKMPHAPSQSESTVQNIHASSPEHGRVVLNHSTHVEGLTPFVMRLSKQ